MLKTRIIPTLLWKDMGLVKGVAFDSWRRVGSVLPAIKVYNARQVDELILLDITATPKNQEPNFDAITNFAAFCFVPLTVGGGVRSLEHAKRLLRSGADKVCINSAAYQNPRLISEISTYFGAQCMVVSIDVKKNEHGKYICYSHCGTCNTGVDAISWARTVQELGAGEIVLTSIENDGTLTGYDLELIQQISKVVTIPVVASGGAGSYEDFYIALTKGGASAVAAASMFHFTEQTPLLAKKYLHEKNIPVRLLSQHGCS